MFTIDQSRCVGCGACIKTCPMAIFSKGEDGTVTARERSCLNCFHCAGVCPTGAISCDEQATPALPLATGDDLLSKFQRRRSIRRFKKDNPDRAVIQAALDGAAYAPSAHNDRKYQWTVVYGYDKVEGLYRAILDWAKDQQYYRVLLKSESRGLNVVTCGAPCLVFVHCPDDCSSPHTDSVIAMELADQLLADAGLGTCWGGYLHRLSEVCPAFRDALNIPEGHKVYGALMVGYPDERYHNRPFRPAAEINWVE